MLKKIKFPTEDVEKKRTYKTKKLLNAVTLVYY